MKQNFGQRLKAFRLAKGLNLREFADKVGAKSPSNINAWESGGSIPSGVALSNIYKAFPELSKEYLENEIGPMQLPIPFKQQSSQDVEMLKIELLKTRAENESLRKELTWAKHLIRILDKDGVLQKDDELGKLHSKLLVAGNGDYPYRVY